MNILSFLLSTQWAITQSAFEMILQIAQREDFNPVELAKSMHGDWSQYIDKDGNFKIDTLEAQSAPHLDGTQRTKLRDGVAIIPVIGPIAPRTNLMTLSGGTSISALAKDFKAALDSDSVKSIIFYFDSPGGEITGIAEMSQLIRESRGVKPILSFVTGYCASGAYWIASATDKIIISPTAILGSLGVIISYKDTTIRDEKRGVKDITIVSSISPKKNVDLNTQSGLAEVQKMVDKSADIFINDVALNRNVTYETVLDKYGKGGVFVGTDAIEQGMAEEENSFETVINKQIKTQLIDGGIMDLKELQTKHPDLYASIVKIGHDTGFEEGKVAGVKLERERLQEIDTIKMPGCEKLIDDNKYKDGMTKAEICVLIVDSQKGQVSATKKALESDSEQVVKVSSSISQQSDTEVEMTEEAMIKAMVDGADKEKA